MYTYVVSDSIEIHGVFSTKENAEKAIEYIHKKDGYEHCFISKFNLDVLTSTSISAFVSFK